MIKEKKRKEKKSDEKKVEVYGKDDVRDEFQEEKRSEVWYEYKKNVTNFI